MSLHVALYLKPEEYPDIRASMLDTYQKRPIGTTIWEQQEQQVQPVPFSDRSFTRQMEELTVRNPLEAPDAILFTHKSAIPVADAVRGFYDEIKQPTPRLDWVLANRTSADRFNSSLRATRFRTAAEKDEIHRLRSSLNEKYNIAIIDQFVYRGDTIRYAAGLVSAATGIKQVRLVHGRWYCEAVQDEVNIDLMTAPNHEAFLTHIGRTAAQSIVL